MTREREQIMAKARRKRERKHPTPAPGGGRSTQRLVTAATQAVGSAVTSAAVFVKEAVGLS